MRAVRGLQHPLVLEQHQVTSLDVAQAGAASDALEIVGIEVALGPARDLVRERLESRAHAVLALQTVLDHVELQASHGAEHRIALAAMAIEVELHRAFLGELLETLLELL